MNTEAETLNDIRVDHSKYSQDSEIFYNGNHDEEKFLNEIGIVKAVRLA